MSRGYYGRRSLARSRASLEPRPRLLVVCEGTVTEPSYFRALRRVAEAALVEVIVDDQGGSPKTLVERSVEAKRSAEREARRERDENLEYDEVWCVFDVDQHPKIDDAKQQARAHSIQLAISNPCFELWALLHFQDQTAYLDRGQARARLKQHLPSYDKELPFEQLHPNYSDAIKRAGELARRREQAQDLGGNPSTGVFVLTERILGLGREEHLRRLQNRSQ